MQNAMMAVEKGEPVRRAAEMFNVPKSTLHDHITGKVMFGARSGPDPYLTVEEEEELASFLIQTAKIGYPHTKKQILSLVQQIVDSKGIDTTVTNGWWERFSQRHPSMTLRVAVPFSIARAMATDVDVLNKYFDMLEEYLRENGIFNKSSNIFNCDECGFPLNPKCLKVVDKIGAKNPSYITSGDKAQVTVLACASASGYAIPPFVVFDRMTLNPKMHEGEVPGTLYGLCHSGWMNREFFNYWFLHLFLEYAPPIRPLILLLDGHSSHYCPETIKLAAEKRIILFALPPHTTHITQPLDRGCFAPLKVAWRDVCHEFCVKNPGRVVTRFDFCQLFSKSWHKAMTMSNVISSFKVTGICPFDRTVIEVPDTKENEYSCFKPESVVQRYGLAYIPLYSPGHSLKAPKSRVVQQTPRKLEPCFNENSRSTSEDSLLSPEASFIPSVPLRRATSLSNFLIPPLPPSKIPTKHGKSSGKVLTSIENIEMIEEKERQKEAEARKKNERRKACEEKAKRIAKQKEEREQRKQKKCMSHSTLVGKLAHACIFCFVFTCRFTKECYV